MVKQLATPRAVRPPGVPWTCAPPIEGAGEVVGAIGLTTRLFRARGASDHPERVHTDVHARIYGVVWGICGRGAGSSERCSPLSYGPRRHDDVWAAGVRAGRDAFAELDAAPLGGADRAILYQLAGEDDARMDGLCRSLAGVTRGRLVARWFAALRRDGRLGFMRRLYHAAGNPPPGPRLAWPGPERD